jgi:putative transposase
MQISRGIKFPLYPSPEQEKTLFKWRGACRHIYNHFLDVYDQHYRDTILPLPEDQRKGKYLSLKSSDITAYKKKDGNEWLREAPSDSILTAWSDLEQARSNFFNPKLKAKYPTKREYFDKFGIYIRINGVSKARGQTVYVRFGQNSIKIPKLGWVKYKKWTKIKGSLGANARIVYDPAAETWHLAVTETITVTKPVIPHSQEIIGIDMGINKTIMTSDGDVYQIHKDEVLDARIKQSQRKLSRAKKGSNRRKKVLVEKRKLNSRKTRATQASRHQITAALVKKNKTFAVEDLKLKNMTKSAKGTVEEPGKNVKAKSGLNRELLRPGLYTIKQQLKYKTEPMGGSVIEVSAKFTSQQCSACGHIAKENRKSQSSFNCVSCGHSENADLNAAKNIRDRACDVKTAHDCTMM